MLRPRVIPVLTLQNRSLVKTERFANPQYLGDPVNAVRILNSKEVDELVILDISATTDGRTPDVDFVAELASECFMPVAFGGGVASVDVAKRLLEAGVEKVVVGTAGVAEPGLLTDLSAAFGAQAVVAAIDVKKARFGRVGVATRSATQVSKLAPEAWAKNVETLGAGEILLTAVDRDGTASGYDTGLIAAVSSAVGVPVIACGGAASMDDIASALRHGAAAAAAGRIFVTHGKHRASLISYPAASDIEALA